MDIRKHSFAIMLLTLITTVAAAQCTYKNTAFKSGEFLSYNLYYNWKFIWVKARDASMSSLENRYNGRNAYSASHTT